MNLASLDKSIVLLQLCQAVEVLDGVGHGVVQGVQALAGDGPVEGVGHAEVVTVDS